MDWSREVERAFAARGASADPDVVTEMAQHAEAAYAAARAEGAAVDDAQARVRALIEGWCEARPTRRRRPATALPPAPPASSSGLAGLGLDVAYALRLMRRQPGAALLTAATLALAIGATTTLASVAYGVLARPLPWPDADRLVRVYETREGGSTSRQITTNVSYHAWRDRARTIDALGAYSSVSRTLDVGNGPVAIRAAVGTASLFELLGVVPVRGRLFTADDEEPANVALISERLWRREFGADEAIIGRTIRLDDERVPIVGVLPDRFGFPELETDAWMPMFVRRQELVNGQAQGVSLFGAIGRLADGATAADAAREATTAVVEGPPVGMVAVAVFGSQGAPRMTVMPLADALTADVRPALLVLLAGVGLLFITAVGGLAAMQVARALSRRREVAIRAAIGAGSGRLARQLVIEHLMMGGIGGLAGLGLAVLLHGALPRLLPEDFPRLTDVVLDWRIGGLAAALAVVASLITAAFPLLQARRLNLVSSLIEGGQAPVGAGVRAPIARMRALVMVAQVAASVVLVVGAGLVGRSFMALTAFDRGYDPVHVLTARLSLTPTHPSAIAQQTFDEIVSRLGGQPGVRLAAYGGSAPFMTGGSMLAFQLQGPGANSDEPRSVKADLALVSPGFIEALGMRVEDGRAFTSADTLTSEPVGIVNRAFMREYFSADRQGVTQGDVFLPLGFLDRTSDGAEPLRPRWRLVGVVQDLAPAEVTEPAPPTIYVSTAQLDGTGFAVTDARFVVRTEGDPAAVAPMLESIARELVPGVPLTSVATLEDRVARSLSRPRLYALLLAGFSGFALLVAGVGLFAMLSHGVAARRREIGVRLALGARQAQVVRLVVVHGLMITLAGVVVGLAATALATRYVESLLFGITSRDPASFVLGVVAVAAGALVAATVPAVRASRVDPIEVLKAG